ncbi:hypothetical protein P280DRAFT_47568 [Massarina eburnea CBS 473.64]|uniref:Uncharacterized protein n=1 Tax=Massarina eburnea CBS 473.64 TaxID=1395130 RepID=A0A6A6RW48_9PLEO|nr:hypothetical protein P280DRAFT_47568 [Massarina eburnea CBS 473.64]
MWAADLVRQVLRVRSQRSRQSVCIFRGTPAEYVVVSPPDFHGHWTAPCWDDRQTATTGFAVTTTTRRNRIEYGRVNVWSVAFSGQGCLPPWYGRPFSTIRSKRGLILWVQKRWTTVQRTSLLSFASGCSKSRAYCVQKQRLAPNVANVQKSSRIRYSLSVFSEQMSCTLREQSTSSLSSRYKYLIETQSSKQRTSVSRFASSQSPSGCPSTKKHAKPPNLRHSTTCLSCTHLPPYCPHCILRSQQSTAARSAYLQQVRT